MNAICCPHCGHELHRKTPRFGLTRQQKRALDTIVEWMGKHGTPPTYAELTAAIGAKSKNTAHRLVEALEVRGYIKRAPRCARSIVLLEPAP